MENFIFCAVTDPVYCFRPELLKRNNRSHLENSLKTSITINKLRTKSTQKICKFTEITLSCRRFPWNFPEHPFRGTNIMCISNIMCSSCLIVSFL